MADELAPAATPANGVSVNPPVAAPVAAAPAEAAPMVAAAPPRESWFSGFDWWKVFWGTTLAIVAVSYVKYTRERAKKDATDIVDIKSQLSKVTLEVSNMQQPAG